MLLRLSIRDFAVVAEAELDFGPGLTVISGETGAGKSLLVDALGFLSGARGDASAVRHGAQRAELAAEFSLDDCPAAAAWLAEQDLDEDGSCQLRRTLRADGGSKAWINGRSVTLSQLAELAGLLVEIHGQHAQQALLARPHQTRLLDEVARHPDLLAATADSARRWKALQQERDALLARGDVSERQAWLQHQLDELDAQPLDPATLAELDASHRRHAHAAGLIAACDAALDTLGGEDAVTARLLRLRASLHRESAHEARLLEVEAMLESACIQLDEAQALLQRIRDDLDLDPEALAALERRLSRIHDLARKHRVPVERLAAHRDALAAELDSLADADLRLQRLDRDIAAALADWQAAAAALSASRRRAGDALADAITDLMGALGMQGGRFEVALEPNATGTPDPLGSERVEFLVSANPGQPLRPLRKVASGGELSRISLAIEVATQGQDAAATLVFDEVDAGIGGAVAAAVGAKLRALGATRQVLCVTHQPQVAAAGHAQYRVSKAAQDGITRSSVQALDAAGRVEEIARMVGGADISPEARAAAKKLLESFR
ncbi:DNA repair protein RecN [Thermomonas hydrothermalis]|uniref:DNA repair protein RecN n=1 Tax=Thermomonas hydrothermalis TaxID=213588 RepID=A0A1M4Y0H5_9GAMM|nr:DNA repair protein RecN [Thermomonas hydrothermalis]SHE99344.1 DNA repair protein RecN (Recombination protein N) [Thermomonas hydrothermalis]